MCRHWISTIYQRKALGTHAANQTAGELTSGAYATGYTAKCGVLKPRTFRDAQPSENSWRMLRTTEAFTGLDQAVAVWKLLQEFDVCPLGWSTDWWQSKTTCNNGRSSLQWFVDFISLSCELLAVSGDIISIVKFDYVDCASQELDDTFSTFGGSGRLTNRPFSIVWFKLWT